MNSELYDRWIKSHQGKSSDIDITDEVMSCITNTVHKPVVYRQTWDHFLMEMMQAKTLLRAYVIASGAVMGVLRVLFQVYSVLFT